MKPNTESLVAVTAKLEQMGISYSLGGSGLLLSLGLTDSVHDWDIMTEAPKEKVAAALQSYDIDEITSGEHPFGTEYKLLIHNLNPVVEVIGGFSIYSDKGLCSIPATPGSYWNGIPMGSPEAWYVAYALMNREHKASLLLSYLKETGGNKDMIERLKQEPLPEGILQEIESLT